MTSVPNPLQQLSGNKILVFLYLASFFACSATKSTTTIPKKEEVQIVDANKPPKEVVKTTVPEKTAPKTKRDTLPPGVVPPKGVEIPQTIPPVVPTAPKPVEPKAEVGLKEMYNAVLYVPFNSADPNASANTRYLHYYMGVKVAAKELESEGLRMNIKVIDSANKSMLDFAIDDLTDVVFAPNDDDQIHQLIRTTKSKGIPVISPWYALSKIENSDHYVQIKPSTKDHFTKITAEVLKNHKADQVVLLGRNTKTDKAWFNYFQGEAQKIMGDTTKNYFSEQFVAEDSLAHGTWVFGGQMNKGKKVFIVPNYSYKDEQYLYDVMRRLYAERGGHTVYVYGMPILKESTKISFDFLNVLNPRVVTSDFVDKSREENRVFERLYFDQTGEIPTEESYKGFDVMMLIGRAMQTYGTKFVPHLQNDRFSYLQTNFNILPVRNEKLTEIQYYENKNINIVEFRNGKWKLDN